MKGKNKTNLIGEYFTTYKKAQTYMELYSEINNAENECLIELNDLLLAAQENNQPVSEVIGDDFRKFISNIYRAYYPFSFTKHIYYRHVLAMFVAIFVTLIFENIPILNMNQEVFTYLNIYFIFIVVQIIHDLVKWVVKWVANKSKRLFHIFTHKKMNYVFQILWFMMFMILSNFQFIKFEVSGAVFIIAFFVSLLPGIVYYILNSKDEFEEKQTKSFKQAFIESIEKKYTKKNRKREKKNKVPYSDRTLAKHLRMVYRVYELINPIVLIGYVILFVFIIKIQIEDSFSIGGVFLDLFILLVMILLTSYYHSRNTIYEYIKALEKRNLDLFKEGVIVFDETAIK